MSIDYTQQLIKQRVTKPAQPPKFQDLPKYAQTATYLLSEISQINQRIRKLQEKQLLKQDQLFQDALNQEIIFLKNDVQSRLQVTTQKLAEYENEKVFENEAKQYKHGVFLSLKSSLSQKTTLFRTLQSSFLSQISNEITTKQTVDLDSLEPEQRQIYTAVQKSIENDKKEAKYICDEIQGIVSLINQMASSVYEQGTVLDRIEKNVMKAQDFAVIGLQNLEQASKEQTKTSRLRRFTYIALVADLLLMIVYAIVK